VFTGSGSQVHDLNPGNKMNGVFWTARIPTGSVHAHPGEGSASMSIKQMTIPDFGNVVRSLQGLPPLAMATVSFDISWSGVIERYHATNENLPTKFTGTFVRNTATMDWSATVGGSHLVGNPHKSGIAIVGHERNGKFFPDEDHN